MNDGWNSMTQKEIFLRRVEAKDAFILSEWFNDSENVKYMSTVIRCKYHTRESIESEIKNSDDNYERLFMACVKGHEVPIGHAGIDDIDSNDKRGEIFFLIGDMDEQGKGYGKIIVRLLLDYAFNELCLNTLSATATLENTPSIIILAKCGFRQGGLRRQYHRLDGRYLDEILFDITRNDYESARTDLDGDIAFWWSGQIGGKDDVN
jgi:RimJ/RimL family protein N-acetyltransferase